jgi:threonine aldolase
MSATTSPDANYTLASDNCAGICPEAATALIEANSGYSASYGDDPFTAKARHQFQKLFETDCEIFFVSSGTAANALALTACCRSPHTRILCHEFSHIDTDECGAPEFFTGGAKVTPLVSPGCKLEPVAVTSALRRGYGVHFPRAGALSLTQTTEWGTVYTPQEIHALTKIAHDAGICVHMDGARFANACAALTQPPSATSSSRQPATISPADLTWRAGVDVLCFGGTKNGMLSTDCVVFFNRDLAREFEYRVKQSGQLSSKMRFAAAQWNAMLETGAWLRHAAHANAQAQRLSQGLRAFPELKLLVETEANAVFIEMAPALYASLEARGWHFYLFIDDHGYRLMCSWATTNAEIDAFLADVRTVIAALP